jgi:hypothetical protein
MEIIPNVPDEIGQQCLLRVSYKSHDKLKAVCRNWEALLSSPQFYEDRKISGTSEQLICLIQAIPPGNSTEDKWQGALAYGLTLYDPLLGTWDRLPSIPQFADRIPLFCQCVWVEQKLVMIGGWHPSRWEAMSSVFIYDFTSCTWRQGADMPTVRSFFACSVSPDGLIYVAGGHDNNKNALRAAEAYDVKHNKWEILPPMSQERDLCHGICLNGKFTVISGYSTELQGRFEKSAEVFDPSAGVWSRLENMWSFGGCPRSCIANLGHLYFFDNQQVMRYNSKENVWELVASLPECMDVTTCATLWRDKIFVSGSTNSWGEQVCYMFDNSGKWVPIDRPHDFVGFVRSAITVEM